MRSNGNGKKISNDEENQQICREEKVDTRAPRASHATFEEYTSSVNVPARCLKQLAASVSVNIFKSAHYYKRRDFGLCLLSGAVLRE